MKLSLSLLLGLLLFIIISLTTYFYLSSLHRENEKFKLTVLRDNLTELLKHEVESAMLGEAKKFLLFSNYKQDALTDKNKQELIVIKQNTLIVSTSKYKLTLDLQELKEFIDQILPAHLVYKISLDKNIIAFKNLKAEQYLNSVSITNIDGVIDLSVSLSINKNSKYYQKNIDKFYKTYFKLAALIFLFISGCCTYYLSVKSKFAAINQRLEKAIEQRAFEQQLLLEYVKVIKKLDSMLNNFEDDTEIKITEINAIELADDLSHYFIADEETNIKIETRIKTQYVSISCSKRIFYQLIFSLINLLIAFMKGQNKQQKSIIISFEEQLIICEFESFALDEQTMIYLADHVLSLPKSSFLLDCHSLFASLKENNFTYSIDVLGEYKHLFAIKSIINKEENPEASRIIKFRAGKDA